MMMMRGNYQQPHPLLSLQVNVLKSCLLEFQWQHLSLIGLRWSHLKKQPGDGEKEKAKIR